MFIQGILLGMSSTSDSVKNVTLPAPTVERLAVAAQMELNRLENIRADGEKPMVERAIQTALTRSYSKDGEFVALPAPTLARLESHAHLMYSNAVKELDVSKRYAYDELRRRGLDDHIPNAHLS